MSSCDPNLNKLMNLIRFNVNLSQYADVGSLERQSPDYILEKYNHWIGFEPVTPHPHYTPDSLHNFFNLYRRIWGDYDQVRRHLLYLYQTKSMNLVQMVFYFEQYFGPIDLISAIEKSGLHTIIERDFLPKVIEANKENLTIILRDMRIKSLNLS
jgi:hypothetical protein